MFHTFDVRRGEVEILGIGIRLLSGFATLIALGCKRNIWTAGCVRRCKLR